jgi:hypothetical protein
MTPQSIALTNYYSIDFVTVLSQYHVNSETRD